MSGVAKGSDRCVSCYIVLALLTLVALAVTNVWNPYPGMWDWVNRSEPLSEPDVVWQKRIGATPRSLTIAGSTVIVEQRTRVESRDLATGNQLWERKADWAAVAGGDQDAVVAVGKLLTKGYELLDPTTGAVRRRDTKAVAVWTYRNGLLDVHCFEATDCTLTAWEPRGTAPRWTAFLPGVNSGLLADNPDLLTTRRLTTPRIHADVARPEPMPSLIGFPVDNQVHILDTATGRVLQDVRPNRQDRLVVVGGRLLRIEAHSADGTCYFTLIARDPANGQEVWRRSGINLRTADNVGCFQREDPQGSGNVVIGVAPDRREVVIDAYDGRLLWTGAAGEKLLAVNDRYALVRDAEKRSIATRQLADSQIRWTRPIAGDAGAALTPYAVVVAEEKPNRLVALDPRTGRELANLRTSAEALAVGPTGMVIGEGREIGFVSFAGSSPASPATDPRVPGAPEGLPTSGDPTCDGPKREQCTPSGKGKDG